MHVDQLPRDENGIPVGDMRLIHEDPSFNADMGAVSFIDGESSLPISGPALARIVAVMGECLMVVPWGDPTPQRLPKPVPERRALETAWPEQDPEDGIDAQEPDDDQSMPSDKDALLAIAEARGVDIDRRWGAAKLQAAIKEHRDAY